MFQLVKIQGVVIDDDHELAVYEGSQAEMICIFELRLNGFCRVTE